jgi:uncharacterized protein
MRTPMLKLLRPLAACLVLTLAAAGPAAAQSPDAVAAAKELMGVMHATDNVKTIIPQLMQALKPAMVQGRPEVARDFDALMPMMIQAMTSRVDEMLDKIAGVYARKFTPEEMREMIAFYRAPVGQKVVQELPNIMRESMTIGQQWGQQLGSELHERMLEELRKKGHNI